MADRRERRPLAPAVRIGLGVAAASVALFAARPSAWRPIVGLLAAEHLFFAAAGMIPRSRLLGPNLSRLPTTAAGRNEVALTFDDGPDPEVTPRVLELLEERGALATFFVVGRRVERHPEIVREAARRGHSIQNHTHRHSSAFALCGPGRMGREIDRAQEAIEAAAGRRPELFRAPAGMRNPWLDPLLARRDLDLVSWSRRGFDAVSADARSVTRRLVDGLGAGEILLLHDRVARRRGGAEPAVLTVLPRLLDEIERRGLTPVTLDGATVREATA